MSGRRDVGSAVLTDGAGPARATSWLRSPTGTAFWIHRPSLIGWLLGSLVLAGTMGALAQQVIDAMVGNSALADALGADEAHPENGFLAVTQLYLAIIACGYVVQAIGGLHHEESSGRLEPRLSGTVSRTRWLAAHGVVILGGLVVIALAGSTTFALAAAWSAGSTAEIGSLIGAGLAYLPAEAVVAAAALVCFGTRPRLFPAIWFAYGAMTFIAFLGPGLKFGSWILDLAPTTHVGNPPLGQVNGLPITVLTLLAVALTAAAVVGFRRRSVPQN
jgi:ABC-2 type transport system permease protein